MTVRTTKKSVTFANPFTLGDVEEVLQQGNRVNVGRDIAGKV